VARDFRRGGGVIILTKWKRRITSHRGRRKRQSRGDGQAMEKLVTREEKLLCPLRGMMTTDVFEDEEMK